MICYDEEALGVIATSLYSIRSCRSMVSSLKRLNGSGHWITAQVRGPTGRGDYQSATIPSIRSASALTASEASHIYRGFDEKVNSIVKPLISQFWGVNLQTHSGTQLLRYFPGGHYVAHQDAGMDVLDRYFTVVCYLNDDFQGGKTSFPSLNYAAVPQCGKTLVFPSRYFHCAEPVITGEKFVLITWIIGPVPIRWI